MGKQRVQIPGKLIALLVLWLASLLYAALGDLELTDNIILKDDKYIGLGPSGGRIIFNDDDPDVLTFSLGTNSYNMGADIEGGGLWLQQQTASTVSYNSLFSSSDPADAWVAFQVFNRGSPADYNDYSRLFMGYDYTTETNLILSDFNSPGTAKDLRITANLSEPNQLLINTDGSVTVNGYFNIRDSQPNLRLLEETLSYTDIYSYSGVLYLDPSYAQVYIDGGLYLIGSNNFVTSGDIQCNYIYTHGVIAQSDLTIDAPNVSANSTVYVLNSDATYKADLDVENDLIVGGGATIKGTNAPVSATATGTEGQLAFDSKYIYRCVATNTWKRTLMSTWTDSYMLMETGDKVLMENGDFIILE